MCGVKSMQPNSPMLHWSHSPAMFEFQNFRRPAGNLYSFSHTLPMASMSSTFMCSLCARLM